MDHTSMSSYMGVIKLSKSVFGPPYIYENVYFCVSKTVCFWSTLYLWKCVLLWFLLHF